MTLEVSTLPAADVSDQEFLAAEDPVETKTEIIPIPDKKPIVEEKEVEEEEEAQEETEEETKEEVEEEINVPEDSKALVSKLREVDPQIFKKIPHLRSIIYSQREYSKIFADPNEARQMYEDNEVFNELSADLFNGSIGSLLDVVGKTNSAAMEKIAKNFLPSLYERNQGLFLKVSVPIINGVLRSALAEAKTSGNKNLELAARYIAKHVHGEPEVPDDRVKPDPEKLALEKKLQDRERSDSVNYESRVMNYAAEALDVEVNKAIGAQFTGVQREVISRKISEIVGEILENDQDHNRVMNSLWKRAKFSGLSPQVANRLIGTYMAKAKAILPGVSTKILAEFTPKTVSSKVKPQFPQSGGGENKSQNITSKTVDYRKSSDMDILLGKAVTKKS